jgi:hypothetical protein
VRNGKTPGFKRRPAVVDLNPDVSANGRWNVHRDGELTLGVNADKLDITDSGALVSLRALR